MANLPLTYVPLANSLHVYLNGELQTLTADYIFNVSSNSVTCARARGADRLEARYAHQSVMITPVYPTYTVTMVDRDSVYYHAFRPVGGALLFDSGSTADGTSFTLTGFTIDDVFSITINPTDDVFYSDDPQQCVITPITDGFRYSWEDQPPDISDLDFNDLIVEITLNP